MFRVRFSSIGVRFGKEPIRAQHFKFQPIREPYLAHVTGLTVRPILGTGTESSAEHGIEAGTGNDVTGPEMTSLDRKCYHGNRDEPEMEKKSRDTVMDRCNNILMGFFTCLVVAVHCPCPTRRELLGCSRRDTIGRSRDRRRVCRRRLCIVWFLRRFLTVWC